MKACLVVVVASIFVQSLLFAPSACAQTRKWQTATVVKADFGGSETEAVAVPLPGGTVVGESSTSSGKHRRGTYVLKTESYTYIIPNYCKANVVGMQWWLYLTVGGETKVAVDSVRTLHVMDDEGKDRKVHIIQRVANESTKSAK